MIYTKDAIDKMKQHRFYLNNKHNSSLFYINDKLLAEGKSINLMKIPESSNPIKRIFIDTYV